MKTLKALAAGLAVGVVQFEAITAGLAAILPPALIGAETAIGFLPGWPLEPVPALVWLLCAMAAGAMATALDGRVLTGLAAGAFMGVSAFFIVGLATPGDPRALLAAALPIGGAAAGAVLADRLRRLDAAVSGPDQAV